MSSKATLTRNHSRLKETRGRGSDLQSNLGALLYLRRLEAELIMVQNLLHDAWRSLEEGKDFRKFLRHSDQAQQRLHKAIKKLR